MECNKALGPDAFPAEFFQACWDIIKSDLMALFLDFHVGNPPLYSFKFGIIILLPKCREAIQIKQYRPICLLNVSFNFFLPKLQLIGYLKCLKKLLVISKLFSYLVII
jgi:hypothetical protein